MTDHPRRRGSARARQAVSSIVSEVLWTDRAWSDLASIEEYIGRENPDAAAKWVEKIMEAVERARVMPEAARVVPEVGRQDVREVFLKTYRIVYRIEKESLVVLTVFEGHRLFPEGLER